MDELEVRDTMDPETRRMSFQVLAIVDPRSIGVSGEESLKIVMDDLVHILLTRKPGLEKRYRLILRVEEDA